ncbi:hypothetical protein [Neptuniibacter sp. QD48_11]|uniref:hypothetical protein n=1 Tax=Neptuniibacter sp. QD48_11 TaxID=3398211 RepID=UPI0039F63D5C
MIIYPAQYFYTQPNSFGPAEIIYTNNFSPLYDQDQEGFLFDLEGSVLPIRLPLNVIFGKYEGQRFFEITEHPSTPALRCSIRYTSEVDTADIDDEGYPSNMLECFYQAKTYLVSRYPSYSEQIEVFLEGLYVAGMLCNKEYVYMHELDEKAHELNIKTAKKRKPYNITYATESAKAIQKPYQIKDMTLCSTENGTFSLNDDGIKKSLISNISCRASIEKNIPMYGEDEFICIQASIPQHDGSITEIEFKTLNTLPCTFPLAAKLAIEQLKRISPDQGELFTKMVAGCIGSLLCDIWQSENLEKGSEAAIKLAYPLLGGEPPHLS